MNGTIRAAELLLIDDDRELADMLREFLAPDRLALSARTSGEQGLEAIRSGNYDLVILDIMLPRMTGLDVLQQIRKFSDLPVIMLTARGDDVDRIIGLEFGADDYLAKPFNPRELIARIRAILRRAQPSADRPQRYRAGAIELDPRAREARVDGRLLRLTGTELEVLRCLLETPGEVVSRDVLSERALGRRLLPYDRSVDTHISNLRGKLERAGAGDNLIQSRRGVGYVLVAGGSVEP